jgi:ABC-type glycerol-3-phosphate transport system substrate-binding protein
MAVACLALPACGGSGSSGSGGPAATGDEALAKAFASQAHDVEVQGEGTVVRVLADDEDGSRHQRFILRLASGQTLLVAHNIDVAPRVEDLRPGDTVAFRGVYEWNAEGGTVHWTHRDPGGEHAPGWLRRNGRQYD